MTALLDSIPTAARNALEDALTSGDGVNAMRVGEDLFGIADLIDTGDPRLRRSLTDPARPDSDKADLVEAAFGSEVTPTTVRVLQALTGAHWSRPDELGGAVEVLGAHAVLLDAKRSGSLSTVEEELFQVQELLADHRELRVRLSDLGDTTAHDRANFAQSLLAEHLSPWTIRLVRRAVGRSSHGRLLARLRSFAEAAALVENRVLVTVETAAPFTDTQLSRLRQILTRRLGTDVTLAVSTDPALVGGFRLRADEESMDASVATRFNEVRRTLVG
ncbi:MAG: F0F1 ATP synthase subunit delta [Actinomycetaceae bacterium]|nr:F0F1 ATP synthase subunit delta [Actinomycetaceae bacterium]